MKTPSSIETLARILMLTSFVFAQVVPAWSQVPIRTQRLTTYADPFVGTENGGNIVPGAQIPLTIDHLR